VHQPTTACPEGKHKEINWNTSKYKKDEGKGRKRGRIVIEILKHKRK
jgi:hypothetical protein